MDLIRLIIESQRRRRRRSQDEVRLRHVDRQIQRRFVPRGVRDGGEVIKPGIRIFAATILILESQLERFRQVEALQCSIERRRPSNTERRSGGRSGGVDLEERHERRRLLPPSAQHEGILALALDDPFRGAETVPFQSRRGLDLNGIAARAHGPDHGRIFVRLEHGYDARVTAARAHDVELRAVAFARHARSFHLQERALEHEMCGELRASLELREHDGTRRDRHKPLHVCDELVGQLVVDPAPLRVHLATPRGMPRQLEQLLLAGREHRHVHDVGRTRHHHPQQIVEPPTHPRPLPVVVEALATGVAGWLGFAIQTRRVVRQCRTIPEQIARDVRARARIGKPVDAVRVQHQLQPVGMAVSPALRPALETYVSAVAAQDRQALALEQYGLRLPWGLAGGKLGEHLEQRPPRQRTASAVRRTLCAGLVQIGFLQLRRRRRNFVERLEPRADVGRPKTCEPDFPDFEISRLRQRDAEP